jgi:hypothetical protein
VNVTRQEDRALPWRRGTVGDGLRRAAAATEHQDGSGTEILENSVLKMMWTWLPQAGGPQPRHGQASKVRVGATNDSDNHAPADTRNIIGRYVRYD